jgi:cell wall-associated NlpC family hydrolase
VRRLIIIFSAAFVAAGFISFTTISAKAAPADQYQTSDGAEAPNAAPESTAPTESQPQAGFISQGSVVDEHSAAVIAERADIAEEERLPDYSQVVDSASTRRFSAPGWEEQKGDLGSGVGQVSYGGGYVYTGSDPGVGPARFKVRIPTSNDYTVYAWWPDSSSNTDAARFGIDTASGRQWTAVDQTTDGGIWIKLGTYAMKKGERTIQVTAKSAGTANAVADAVAVVRGDVTMPPAEPGSGGTTSRSADGTYSTSSLRDPNGRDVVRVAKKWLGTRYRWGTCTKRRMSCTCETKKTYKRFGHILPMTEGGQWRYDRSRKIRRKSNLRIGDEVFFKENGRRGGITHVGIYSGNGNIVHASSYFGKVVESKMRYISGYFGAKRYRLH